MAVRVNISKPALNKFLATSPQARRVLEQNADALRDSAKELMPIGQSVKWGPIYRNGKAYYSHKHDWVRQLFRARRYREYYRVENTYPFYPIVEWGSIKNRPYAPMRKAVRASRLRFVPNPGRGEL
jgi:hypothetical protein